MSSNPFRKKGPPSEPGPGRPPQVEAIDTSVAQASRPPPPVSFGGGGGDQDRDDEQAPEVPAPEKKPKVVKKVRVLSPPPLSPDSPEWPSNSVPDPAAAAYPEDPFNNAGADEFGGGVAPPQQDPAAAAAAAPGPPANPFSKTLQDLESEKKELELKEKARAEGESLKAANSRGSLNVDSFRRLLMTGNAGDGGAGAAGPGAPGLDSAHDGARGPSAENQTVEDEGDMSDSSVAVQIGQRKKAPPPPPSSRHGRSINKSSAPEVSQTGTEGDVEPHHAEDPGVKPSESEPEQTGSTKKAAPAPPPRRGHARAESKTQAPSVGQRATQDEEQAHLSSQEAVLGRSNSGRHGTHAPAPPPRRRPNAGQRQSTIQTSPTSGNFNATQQHAQDPEKSAPSTPSHDAPAPPEPSAVQDPHTGNIKLSAPPPPPARNSSTRRPPSVSSMEAPGRQVSGESGGSRGGLPPPPPPSRKRGSSKGSMDGPSRMTSSDAVPRQASGQQQQPPQPSAPSDPGQGDAILADLNALQREVDALRGKVG